MYKIYIITGCLLFSFVFFSCKKDQDDNGHGYMCSGPQQASYITSPDLLNCEYKTGTYWIYYDSISTITDSLYIVSFAKDFVFDQCVTTYQYHSFITRSTVSLKNVTYVVVAGGLFKEFDGNANSGTRIYPSQSLHDSVFIYDRYYKDVSEVMVEHDPTEANNKSIYFLNSEYGILKHEVYSTTAITNRKVIMRKSIVR